MLSIRLALGGKCWGKIGQVWHGALANSGALPHMTMPEFAGRTRQVAGQLYPGQKAVAGAVDGGWKVVGL